ncbi:CBS domain-containing protein [Vibrio rumoiensis]|uniref:CBS domain-containing protein n=1 Tax=Vibrio rumoiensis TaxID=76258 RepID=A0ABW7IUW2_9VIBR|nr:CBS domain-containing protein [Vibrio rumoiensis]
MPSLKVRDYMRPRAVTFTVDMTLSTALDKVLNAINIGGPVVNEKNEVVGFLSEQDLLNRLIQVSYHCQDTHSVGDCMRVDALTISPEMSVIELANMMQEGKPKVYPVVENKKLVGIISRREVLKAVSDNLDNCFKHPL